MLALISPAKTLDFDTPPGTDLSTQPEFLPQARDLIHVLRDLVPHEISSLMGISDKLGELNFDRFARWHTPFAPGNAKQALLAFKGDVYTGLEADRFNDGDFDFAQRHLRILSGLYGLLRPMDLIQPYRLEMGTRLANPGGRNLYQFWGERITRAINRQLEQDASPVVVNLASNEYYHAVLPGLLEAPVVTPVFKDFKNGRYKVISFYAKKARGLMAAYLVRRRLIGVEALKDFREAGYAYDSAQSTETQWVFTRTKV